MLIIRRRDIDAAGNPNLYAFDSLQEFNHFIGRPRIRQVRSQPLVPCPIASGPLTNFYNSSCFATLSQSYEDTRPFRTGDIQWTHQEADVPSFLGLVDRYPGSGFSMVLQAVVRHLVVCHAHHAHGRVPCCR